jgi:hypothetical protein
MSNLKDEKIKSFEGRAVTLSLGYTVNTGNFESLRVDIGYTDSVAPDETHADAADRIYNDLSSKLVEKIKEIKEELGG